MKLPRLRVFLPWFVGLLLLLTALRGVEPVHSLALLPLEQAAQKYGIFVHYVWGGASGKTITVNRDGSRPAGLQEVADNFDAAGFARDAEAMGVEYVIFTAWHANMNLLYPSKAMDRWISAPDHTANRDVIQDLLDQLTPRGIRLYLYTHPQDGHDFTPAEQAATNYNDEAGGFAKWNDFADEIYGDLVARYGTRVAGYWIDCCTVRNGKHHVNILMPDRLRATIKRANPQAVIMETAHYAEQWGFYFGDVLSKEINNPRWFGIKTATWDVNTWPAQASHVSIVEGPTWWASNALDAAPAPLMTPAKLAKSTKRQIDDAARAGGVKLSPEGMFRYTVLQAGANTDGMGVAWAAGPYPGGGWEPGVREALVGLGRLIAPVAPSIKGTFAGKSYPTARGTALQDLSWGVSTDSPDGRRVYLHVLKAPAAGLVLELPTPADGRRFVAAKLVRTGKAIALQQHKNTGALTVTLPPGSKWDRLDTVIQLEVAPPAL